MNRAEFFRSVRTSLFNGRLGAKQVEGMNLLLDVQEQYFPQLSPDELAYCLATPFHETGATMQPIKERGGKAYFTRMYDIRGARPQKARELGNLQPGDGAKFPGMGFAQNTGRGNARKATKIIREVLGENVDFEKHPEKLMVPLYSAILLFHGMIHGTYTGKKLRDYIDGDGREDPGEFQNARRIINGRDRDALIATYASLFLKAIQLAEEVPDEPAGPVEVVTTGKPLFESRTALASLSSAAIGGVAVTKEAVSQARDAVESAKQAKEIWDILAVSGPWIIALLAILIATGIVLYERHKKSVQFGI